MPIYAYRCNECGHAQDILQKISDPILTVCPSCNQSAFTKQVTAAGFHLKGTGWYVTDFRNSGNNGGAAAAQPDAKSSESSSSEPGTSDTSPASTEKSSANATSSPAAQ